MISRIFGSRSGSTSAAELRYWLLVYNPVEQRLVEEREFENRDEAESEYSRLEAEHRAAGDECQVVLLGAGSRTSLERTHPHYFRGPAAAGDTLEFLPV